MTSVLDPEREGILRRGMKDAGLKAILAWFPEDLAMVGGTWPCLGMNLCLYPAEGRPVYYMPPNEPADVGPVGFTVRHFDIEPGNWTSLKTILRSDIGALGLTGLELGTEPDDGQHAVTTFSGETPLFGTQAISTILSGIKTCDATAFFTTAGLRKTGLEIERIRRANVIAGIGLSAFHAEIKPGRTEAEVAASVEGVIQSQSGKQGCSLARAWAQVQAGPNIYKGGTFSRSSGQVLCEGDLVLIELGTCVDGYWSDLTRTACVGRAGDRQKALLTAVKGAQAAAIAVVRPGLTHEAVDKAARDYLEERGYGKGFMHNCGHQVGFRYHDRGPVLQKGSKATLETGMIITIEPGCYGEAFGGGARFEDDILVTASGSESLSPRNIVWTE